MRMLAPPCVISFSRCSFSKKGLGVEQSVKVGQEGLSQTALQAARPVPIYSWYVLLILFLAYVMSYMDRNILSILVDDIKADIDIDDAQAGFLYGTAFSVFYCIAGITLARLADGWRRGRIISIGLLLWSSMTAASGLASNFAHLTVARMGVAIGEASLGPSAYSLIADYFPKHRRGLAIAIFSAGIYAGGALALTAGGAIASHWNLAFPRKAAPFDIVGWQAAFLFLALPGFIVALLVYMLREPLRGESDGEGAPVVRPGIWRAFAADLMAIVPPFTLWHVSRFAGGLRRNIMLLAAAVIGFGGLAYITNDVTQWVVFGTGIYAFGSWLQSFKQTSPQDWALTGANPRFIFLVLSASLVGTFENGIGFWRAPYLLRTFYPNMDGPGILTFQTARVEVGIIGMCAAFFAAFGVVLGGVISDYWAKRNVNGRFLVIPATFIPYIILIAIGYSANSLTVFLICAPLSAMLGAMSWPSAIAAILDMCGPNIRATATTIALVGYTMVGAAIGPYVVGKVSVITGSLVTGVFSLYLLAPLVLICIWRGCAGLPPAEG